MDRARRSPRRVEPAYQASNAAELLVLYSGNLAVRVEDQEHVVRGQVQLRLLPSPRLVAHFAGPLATLGFLTPWSADSGDPVVSVPDGEPLRPPTDTSLPTHPEGASWVDQPIALDRLDAGDIISADRFRLYVVGSFDPRPPRQTADEQPQIRFRLPGWDLVLVPSGDGRVEELFAAVVEAQPETAAANSDDIESLRRQLFLLLSFIAGRELGVGPIVGCRDDDIVWARWDAPRHRAGRPGVRWCPRDLVADAIPALAEGYGRLAKDDDAMKAILDRSINHLLATDGDEPLDVRVPVACAGLELLAWAVLQREGWLGANALRRLTAAARTRLLLQWARLSDTIPDTFAALHRRRDRVSERDAGGPEVLHSVRNAVMHPPKRLDDPEWPETDELVESWQLAGWYLELVILRLLGYHGNYWSRLRLGRMSSDVEPVPWSTRATP